MVRNQMRRHAAAATAALMVAVGLAACGDDASEKPASNAASQPQQSTGVVDPKLNAMLPEEIRSSKTLKIATDPQYPPCEWYPKGSKTMVGFEPDLWNAMAARLGVKVETSDVAFDGLIPGVQSGRFPIAMECISDNAEREKQVSFVDFIYAELSVFTLKSNPKSLSDDPFSLCGHTAAAQRGLDVVQVITDTLSPHCTEAGKPPIKLLQFPSNNAVLLSIYSGRADFFVIDRAAGEHLNEAAPKPLTAIANDLLPKLYLGIVVNKQDTDLQKAMLGALEAIQADGTYKEILDKWNLGALALDDPGINLATQRPLPGAEK